MGKGLELTFIQRRYTNGQWAYEEMLKITNYEGNANQNVSEIPLHTHRNGIYTRRHYRVLTRGWKSWWEWKTVQSRGKTVRWFFKQWNTEEPYDLTNPLLSVYPKELRAETWTDTCTPTFIITLFTIAKTWKQMAISGWVENQYVVYATTKYFQLWKR